MDQNLNINPFNFLILSGVVQCLILIGVSLLSKKGRILSQVLLFLTIVFVCFHLMYLTILDLNLEIRYPFLLWFPYSFLTGIGPLVFLYTKSIVLKDYRPGRKEWMLFIPLSAEVFIQLFMIDLSISQGIQVYNVPYAGPFLIITYLSAAVSIFYYLGRSSTLLERHQYRIEQHYSTIQHRTPIQLNRLLKQYKFIWMCWIPFAILFLLFFRFQMQYLVLLIPIYGSVIAITYLTYWIILENRIIAGQIVPLEKENSSNSSYQYLSTQEIANKLNVLNGLLTKEKVYLNDDLSLRGLAEKAEIEPNLTSFLLNAHLGVSFFDFINTARVEEFKKRLASGNYNHLTFLAIAMECGFSSKSSFNRIFKKQTGMTPRKYAESQK